MIVYLNLSGDRNAPEEAFTASDVEDEIIALRAKVASLKRELAIYKPLPAITIGTANYKSA